MTMHTKTIQPRILIMAGGTGGHIMPALAVGQALRHQGWAVSYIGNPDGMEGRLVPAQGFSLLPCHFSGLRGKGWRALVRLPLRLWQAWRQAAQALDCSQAQVVLGFGGYMSFPGALVARWRGVPVLLHEQNAVAGTANRIIARFAKRRLVGFPGVLPPSDWVGNPVRSAIAQLPDPAQRYAQRQGPLRIVVVGGSLGAQWLNTVVPQALAQCPAEQRPQVLHQAGQAHIQALQAHYASLGVQAQCTPFIDDMAQALSQADLLICRAGAMTVAEVASAGVAALFVPLPTAIDDHQTANAQYLCQQQAALLYPQGQGSAMGLAQLLQGLSRADCLTLAQNARALAMPQATQAIVQYCYQALGLPNGDAHAT